MHEVVRAKIAWFSDEGHALRGVVHVGANVGQEIPWYLHRNHRPIIAFEPHPDAFADLDSVYGDGHGVICVNAALGDTDGELTLLVPQDGDSQRVSKYQPIPYHGEGHEWTHTPNTGGELHVPLRRFDSWAAETCIDLSPFDVLVVDVQGMELEVLRGMGSRLDGFRYLNIECSASPVYDGEVAAQEVIDWLAAQGFERQTPVEVHDDILFLRVREPAAGAPAQAPSAERQRAESAEAALERKGYDPDPPALNEWAKGNGWKGRGPIPKAVREAYAKAFPA